MASKNKYLRYRNLIRNFSNWPDYLRFKVGQQDAFTFRLRDSFSVRVFRQMLSPFRECFFDQIYLKHLPDDAISSARPTIVDIGANVGFFSLFMFYKYPQATIYSFEPMPFNFRQLSEYHRTYPAFDWHVDARAVSGSDKPITLYTSSVESFTTMASVFNKPKSQTLEVEATTLSQLVDSYGIDHIDILKLDCEGAEYSIIYAIPEDLLKSIRVFLIETHQGVQSDENTQALVAYLRQHGFAQHHLSEGKSGYVWAWRK